MKLRNKKTGEIVDFADSRSGGIYDYRGKVIIENQSGDEYSYDTLAKLHEEWEDAEGTNATNIPLIKDEKIKNLLGEVVEMELTVNELSRRFEEFNKHFAELNASREDVKEPLIKDEKICKAVRAWADACRLTYATYDLPKNRFYDAETRGKFEICFTLKPVIVGLKDGKAYTIEELCGELQNDAEMQL